MKNDIGLEDEAGMNIVDFAVSPHYRKEKEDPLDSLRSKVNYQIINLTDDQAVFYKDGKRRIIQ